MATCLMGSKGMVRQLLQYRVDPNIRDQKGVDALGCVINSGSEDSELVNLLLEPGSDPDHADERGNTPLHRACSQITRPPSSYCSTRVRAHNAATLQARRRLTSPAKAQLLSWRS